MDQYYTYTKPTFNIVEHPLYKHHLFDKEGKLKFQIDELTEIEIGSTIRNPWTYQLFETQKLAFEDNDDIALFLPRVRRNFLVCGFETEEAANLHKQQYEEEHSKNDYGYLVLKNKDFSNGQSPSDIHKFFKHRLDAHRYILKNDGINGEWQRQTITYGVNLQGYLYGIVGYSGYSIEEIKIE